MTPQRTPPKTPCRLQPLPQAMALALPALGLWCSPVTAQTTGPQEASLPTVTVNAPARAGVAPRRRP